jgi:hypothetical protein
LTRLVAAHRVDMSRRAARRGVHPRSRRRPAPALQQR